MGIELIEGRAARNLTAEAKWDLLSPYLRQHGTGCLAYSTLQDGLNYIVVPGRGYVATKRVGRLCPLTCVLGDPICRATDMPVLLNAITEVDDDAAFFQVSSLVSRQLAQRGFYVNSCGIESRIDIRSYNFAGGEKRNLRTAASKAKVLGITIEEMPVWKAGANTVRALTREWLKDKTAGEVELSFLARPTVYRDEPYVRTFFAFQGSQCLGFVGYDPMFRDNRVFGYGADLLRVSKCAPNGLLGAIQLAAIEKFKTEGVETVSLGWSPFCNVDDRGEHNSWFTTLIFVSLFQLGNTLYSFKGLAASRAKFCGRETPVYFGSKHKYPIRQLYGAFAACNVHPFRQLMRSLRRTRKGVIPPY